MTKRTHRRPMYTPLAAEQENRAERPIPAKLPKGFCKRGKGPHDFQFVQEHSARWPVLQRDGSVEEHLMAFKEYACTFCGKKHMDYYNDGVLQ